MVKEAQETAQLYNNIVNIRWCVPTMPCKMKMNKIILK